jgi:DnaB-like helicase N terminal domain/AAA domain
VRLHRAQDAALNNVTSPAKIELPDCPCNLEAEQAILGAILLDNGALAVAATTLRAEDFSLSEHRKIFGRMVELSGKSIPIDILTLHEEFSRTGDLESAGGAAYIARLPDGLPRVNNIAHYARIIRQKSVLRQLAHIAEVIREEALSFHGDDAGELLTRSGERFAALCANTGLTIEDPAWRNMFHSYAEFEESAPLSFAIGGFLQNQGATMIGGLSGHGKTLILCSISRALLSGRGTKLWDLFPVEENAVRIVYLIPECSIAPFKHRLQLFGIYSALAQNDERLLVRTLSKGPTPCLSDPRILFAAKGAHVVLDTATRFVDGDENSAGDNMRGLASDIFALLGSGTRSVIAAHHSPKPFARENTMRLENVLRGSGDIGAMLTTAWGVKQLDAAVNVIHIENVKPRDFQPCGPFQIVGRPFIDETGDFRILKRPGACGSLIDEQEPKRDHGGASQAIREARAANIALMRGWLRENPGLTSTELVRLFADEGIKVGDSAIRKYRKELRP